MLRHPGRGDGEGAYPEVENTVVEPGLLAHLHELLSLALLPRKILELGLKFGHVLALLCKRKAN